MNKAIISMTIKQFWSRKVRVLITIAFVFLPLLMDIMFRQVSESRTLNNSGSAAIVPLIALTISAGIIGQDISDGILPSILSRPIKRWTYVFSKWLTASCLAISLASVNLAIHMLFTFCVAHDLGVHGLDAIAQIVIMSFGVTSVVLLLSSLLPGAADIGVILLMCIICFVMMVLQESLKVPGMTEAAGNIFAVLFPSFDLSDIRSVQSLFSIEVGRYTAIVLICLSGSVVLVNQKELSYGSN